jgi:hypothetical protein
VVFLNIERQSLQILNASVNTKEILGVAFNDVIEKKWSDEIVGGSAVVKTKLVLPLKINGKLWG